jgi:hypothetical protein
MKVDFQVTYTATCDIEDAFNDFETILSYAAPADPERAIYEAINENLICPQDVDVPDEVIEKFATMLKLRIGGVQMEMEGVR